MWRGLDSWRFVALVQRSVTLVMERRMTATNRHELPQI